jgi:2-keto-4-pentenoate hydratase/2-oxohepta-3-ene-1,7-dioic acid hydratase in catechol pathway
MGLVIGKAIGEKTNITAHNLGEYVHGVVLCNEMSLRDVMFSQPFGQWFKAKSWRSSSPFGCIVYLFETPEEAALIHHLNIKLWLNDELRQNGKTANLITKPQQALTEISQWCNMDIGDVLLTGRGGAFRMPPVFPKTLPEFIEAQRQTGITRTNQGKFDKNL